MKFLFTIVILVLIPSLVSAQKTKLVEKAFRDVDVLKESYFVLKKNEYTRHGEYRGYHRNGKLKISGQYHFNHKDGEWREYSGEESIKRITVFEKGKKISDRKAGIWREHHEGGKVVTGYDYNNNETLRPIFRVYPTYPAKARNVGLEGTVEVLLVLNENCTDGNAEIVKSLSKECDEAALKTANELIALIFKYDKSRCANEREVVTFDFKLK